MTAAKSKLSIFLSGAALFILIIDAKTAIRGAYEGIQLCLTTIIPSLFPFFVITTMLIGAMTSSSFSLLKPLGRLLHLPENGVLIFLIGLLGGYPIGAQSIRQSYDNGQLSEANAGRMLAFCNNAGPSFLFGIGATILPEVWMCWLAWMIQIISSCIVCLLTPSHQSEEIPSSHHAAVSISEAIQRSIRVMATVCSWIVLFKIFLVFLSKWALWILPDWLSIVICGLLELANGCTRLSQIPSIPLRFLLFSTLLSGGGVCVAMQTKAVLAGSGLSLRPYWRGKGIQFFLSGTFGILLLPVFFQTHIPPFAFPLLLIALLICIGYYVLERKSKKSIAFWKRLLYNGGKSHGGNTYEAIS